MIIWSLNIEHVLHHRQLLQINRNNSYYFPLVKSRLFIFIQNRIISLEILEELLKLIQLMCKKNRLLVNDKQYPVYYQCWNLCPKI